MLFLKKKLEAQLYSNIGESLQVKEDPNKYVQVLTYDSASILYDIRNTVNKANNFIRAGNTG